jgi:hypothetical protein
MIKQVTTVDVPADNEEKAIQIVRDNLRATNPQDLFEISICENGDKYVIKP